MPAARRSRSARATGPFTSKNCSGAVFSVVADILPDRPQLHDKSGAVSALAHIFDHLSAQWPASQPLGYCKYWRYLRLATGTPLAYCMLKLAAGGEDHDRFLHDGSIRGTSIPLGLRRNLHPFPP